MMKSQRPSPADWILAIIVALVLKHALLAAFGFRYRLFSDPFDRGKLALDLGAWAIAFAVAWLLLDRISIPRLPRR
jgi:predicted Abi (CAAX) family protease